MNIGQRVEEGIFTPFGNEITFDSYRDLLDKLAVIDRPVPRRTEGRRQRDRERYCIVAYLLHLAEAELLEYPLHVVKGEAPDFVLHFPGGRTRGVEVTEASTPEHQAAATELDRAPAGTLLEGDELREPGERLRGRGYVGDEAEQQWSQDVLEAIERKLGGGYEYGEHHELDLLIYDQTGLGALVMLENGAPFLREAVRSWRRAGEPQQVFSRFSVLRDSGLLFDVTGRWQVLRPRPIANQADRPPWRRPETWPPEEQVAALCRRRGIRRLSLFGSALRGEDARDSDLDFLVELEPDAHVGYFGLAEIERELSDLFGRSVDLRTPAELGPHLRERVLREAETEYARNRREERG